MINSYFSDTEAVEACICRLNVMWCAVAGKHREMRGTCTESLHLHNSRAMPVAD